MKTKLLNRATRVNLAKSVLNAIPTYYMQVAWIPQAICSQKDKLTCNFLWKGSDEKSINLVGWETIARSKKAGGLGVRISRFENTAMLGKLVWDIHQKSNKLWVEVVRSKYLGTNHILDIPSKNGSVTWNAIMKTRDAMREGFVFRLGDGSSSL